MSLSEQEKLQIANVVHNVIDNRLSEMTKDILAGFVEALDWHNENFAKIMNAANDKTLAHITKQKREVIEIRSKEYVDAALERQKDRETSSRLGFRAKAKSESQLTTETSEGMESSN